MSKDHKQKKLEQDKQLRNELYMAYRNIKLCAGRIDTAAIDLLSAHQTDESLHTRIAISEVEAVLEKVRAADDALSQLATKVNWG